MGKVFFQVYDSSLLFWVNPNVEYRIAEAYLVFRIISLSSARVVLPDMLLLRDWARKKREYTVCVSNESSSEGTFGTFEKRLS